VRRPARSLAGDKIACPTPPLFTTFLETLVLSLDGVDRGFGEDFLGLGEVGEVDAWQFGLGCARGNSPSYGLDEGFALSEGPGEGGCKCVSGANGT
jgi:hypothetical protein